MPCWEATVSRWFSWEAKRYGESLSNYQSQVLAYASELGIRYPALTNGNDWQVYDNLKLAPIDERRILNVSLIGDPAHNALYNSCSFGDPIWLKASPWRPPQPIVEVGQESSAVVIVDEGHDRPGPEDNGGWVSLNDFSATSGTSAPTIVRFPSGEERPVKNWRYLYVGVAEWLVREGVLTAGKCPISAGSKKGYCLIHSQPRHPNGKDFLSPHELSNGLFVCTHVSAKAALVRCKALLEHFDKDLSGVRLQVS